MPASTSFLLLLLLAYLIGAVPFGVLVARWRGVDILRQGSGNIGATNVGRVLGRRFGVLVFMLDFAKGAVPVWLARLLGPTLASAEPSLDLLPWAEVGAGLTAFCGHLFPVYLGFRGGKGVATGAGAVTMLVPIAAAVALFAWVTVVCATRYVSLASLAAAAVLYLVQWTMDPGWSDPRTLFCLVAGVLVFARHRANIARLVQGNEHRLGESTMLQLTKTLHVLALGLWFGAAVFFTFFVTLSLFQSFETLAQKPAEQRPLWFPLAVPFDKADEHVGGPKEQGSRAAGYAVGPMFYWFFLVQGACGFLAAATSLPWARSQPGKVHRWRAHVLLVALATVVIGWPLERKVTDLRAPRNQATDAYLQANDAAAPTLLSAMKEARSEFGRWHAYSLLLNFATVALVTAGMAMAAKLPAE